MNKQLEAVFNNKTSSWTDSEVIIVNGMKCCYTVIKNEGYLVHLPGGVKKFAQVSV